MERSVGCVACRFASGLGSGCHNLGLSQCGEVAPQRRAELLATLTAGGRVETRLQAVSLTRSTRRVPILTLVDSMDHTCRCRACGLLVLLPLLPQPPQLCRCDDSDDA